MNLAALSTREMGPGARYLSLDDNWSGWNWKKILGMGISSFLVAPKPGTDYFFGRLSPSKLVESPPYEEEAYFREPEV